MTTMIDVGLADDDPLVRRTLTDILNTTEDIRVAWAVRDGQEVLDRLGSGDAAVEVLLLDIQMPRIDGIALAEILHRERPELGVLILTTFVADAVLERALAAGVRGFLAKEDPITTLADTIRHVASGNMVLSPSSSALIGHRATPPAPAAPSTAPAPGAVALSHRELEVLALMVEALSNKQIAHRLGVSEATVKTHVSALIAKLGVQDRVGAVVHALRNRLV